MAREIPDLHSKGPTFEVEVVHHQPKAKAALEVYYHMHMLDMTL